MTTKKKAKSGIATKKTAKKKSAKKGKEETNPAQVRKDVSRMVESEAVEMAQAVIDERRKKGQLATMKYLFEMAAIYPAQADQDSATADEDCFAKTLLHRLNIPDEPIPHSEDEEPNTVASAEKTTAEPADEGETKNPEPGLP